MIWDKLFCKSYVFSGAELKKECDWLWKTAVPQIKQFCDELHVSLQLVDVNWREACQQPLLNLSSSSAYRRATISDCQKRSIGPDFVVCSAFEKLLEDSGSNNSKRGVTQYKR
jgi:hypothetical protein